MNLPNHPMYVLLGEEMTDTEESLYWNNEDGWVLRPFATVFNMEEVEDFNEPQGSLGWMVA